MKKVNACSCNNVQTDVCGFSKLCDLVTLENCATQCDSQEMCAPVTLKKYATQ
jgi:hypothetical protein